MPTKQVRAQEKGADYAISKADAKELLGLTLLPSEFRRMVLRKYVEAHGADALLNLFAEFVGMARSIEVNTREFIELYLIVECDHSDRLAEQINLPTITGALQGIEVAGNYKGMCGGCAFRLGTAANQSLITTIDAHDCADDGTNFMCHERGFEEGGERNVKCAGYVAAMQPWQREIVMSKRKVRKP